MSRALGLTVVGEGVENDAQARFLRDLGCDLLQGFLYQRPAPVAVIDELLSLRPEVPQGGARLRPDRKRSGVQRPPAAP